MNSQAFTIDEFRKLASDRFRFLEARGFRREPTLEATTPTGCTVVYLGEHVGFIFSLDLRDRAVDGQVVRVRAGQIKRNWEGGYSSNIFGHLVRHSGYRGAVGAGGRRTRRGRTGRDGQDDPASLERQLDGWVNLLQGAGQGLLSDLPDSLPA